jgi:hypothetical protein
MPSSALNSLGACPTPAPATFSVRNFDTPPLSPDSGRTFRHNLSRYNHTRDTLDQHLETLIAEAEARDAARQ